MAELSRVIVHKTPFFLLHCCSPWPPAWDLISLFSPHTVPTLRHQTSFLSPCLRVTGLSGQADASLSVQSEAGLGPRPAVPRSICLSVCLSSPAVALASHLGVKSPSVMDHNGQLSPCLCGTVYETLQRLYYLSNHAPSFFILLLA